MKSIAIVGAGAVGLFYGARLQSAGADVRFLLRRDYGTVSQNGISVVSPSQPLCLPKVKTYRTTVEIGPVDLVIVSVKATSNDDLVVLLPPLLHGKTVILTLQNGLGNEEFLASHFGEERILGGLCFVCLNRIGEGVVENFLPGSVGMGAHSSLSSQQLETVAQWFRLAGIKLQVSDNLALMRWKKLVWNVPFNGLAIAAGGITTDLILENPGLRQLVRILMQEVQNAAAGMGLSIPSEFLDKQIEITGPMGPYKPSSLIDYLEGRPVEVEAIWGEPLRRAAAVGVRMPALETLYLLLRALCDVRRSPSSGKVDSA